MGAVQGWFFLVMGAGVVAVALQGLARGWLPNGPNGFKEGNGVHRAEQPVAFWFFFLLYFLGGLAISLYALRILLGTAAPLPLR